MDDAVNLLVEPADQVGDLVRVAFGGVALARGRMGGADRLHLSGITPALGPIAAKTAIAEAASARGITVSFDGNWRGKLRARWGGGPRRFLLVSPRSWA